MDVRLGTIPSIIFILLLLTVPESPRSWQHKRNTEALDILSLINGNELAQQELKSIDESLRDETPFSFADIKTPQLKRALVIGIALAVLSQITGINAIMYYAPGNL
jgi:SP family arabinose:H+ symporter-like MFS transporter